MKKKFRSISKMSLSTVLLIIIIIISISQTVFAAKAPVIYQDPNTYYTIDELTNGIKNDMINRQCGDQYIDDYTDTDSSTETSTILHTPVYDSCFVVNYYGNRVKTKDSIDKILNTIFSQDNYLENLCWDYSYSFSGRGKNVAITFNFTWLESVEDTAAVTSKVDSELHRMGIATVNDTGAISYSVTNDYQKEELINDYIVNTLYYDSSYDQHSAYAGLINSNHTTVCQGYALLTYKFFSEAGIPVKIVTNDSQDHVWNEVQIDGNWYQLDNTWDDPVDSIDNPGYNSPTHDYYNLTDDQMAAVEEHSFARDQYPLANTDFKTQLATLINNSDNPLQTFYKNLYITLGYDS